MPDEIDLNEGEERALDAAWEGIEARYTPEEWHAWGKTGKAPVRNATVPLTSKAVITKETFAREVADLLAQIPAADHPRTEALLAAALDETRGDRAWTMELVRAELGLSATRNLRTLAFESEGK
jgi:hypothetical protein